jgi:hypothetical protein
MGNGYANEVPWFIFGCCVQSICLEFLPASVPTALTMFRSTPWLFELTTCHSSELQYFIHVRYNNVFIFVFCIYWRIASLEITTKDQYLGVMKKNRICYIAIHNIFLFTQQMFIENQLFDKLWA